MIICQRCGLQNQDGAVFCNRCGNMMQPMSQQQMQQQAQRPMQQPVPQMQQKPQKKKTHPFTWFVLIMFILSCMAYIGKIDRESKERKAAANDEITFEPCTVDQMLSDLDENAITAKEKYNNKYIEVTGRLGVIDSNGKYICIYSQNPKLIDIIGVQCYIKDTEQKQTIKGMKIDDIVTIRVKITDVGEVIGYSADILQIKGE